MIKDTGRFGLGLYATRDFAKGSVLYRASCVLTDRNEVPGIDYDHFCVFDVEHGKFQVYGFDRYMNHSCEPNCVTTDPRYVEGGLVYSMTALADIKAGSQLFEDYFHFEYDEMKIVDCACGAENCQGKINGFRNLPLVEKLRRVSLCEVSLIEKWVKDDPTVKVIEAPPERRAEFPRVSGLRQTLTTAELRAESERSRSPEAPTRLFRLGNKFRWAGVPSN